MSETIEVADNVAAARFEVRLDGTVVGFADYVLKGGTIILSHTDEATYRADLEWVNSQVEVVTR